MSKWIKIFKAGTLKDSKGREHVITHEELDNRVTLYNQQAEDTKRQAPHVLGHPDHNAPAYGWVEELKRDGDYLLAKTSSFVDQFEDLVKSGKYRFRSASFYGNGLLRHVGWLGAAQPAVAGLGDAEFLQDDEYTEFSDFMDWESAWSFRSLGSILQGLRDYFISKESIEVADNILPQYSIDELKRSTEKQQSEYTEKQTTEKPQINEDKEMTEQLEKLQSDFAELKADRDALKVKTETQASLLNTLDRKSVV